MLQQCVTYPKLLEAWHTKLLGNVLAELRGAFALSLVSATTEVLGGQCCTGILSPCACVIMTSLLCMATPPAEGMSISCWEPCETYEHRGVSCERASPMSLVLCTCSWCWRR